MILYIFLFIALTWFALLLVVLFEKFGDHMAEMKKHKAEALDHLTDDQLTAC